MIEDIFYSKKVTRQIACSLLVSSGCQELPINICDTLPDKRILLLYKVSALYDMFRTNYDEVVKLYGSRGLIYYNGEKYFAYINFDCDEREYTFSLALALAYVYLDIVPEREIFSIHEHFTDVNEFATYLLAPNCVLFECGFMNNADIMNHTGLSFKNALYKERDLKKEIGFNRYYPILSIEKILIAKFRNYISRFKK